VAFSYHQSGATIAIGIGEKKSEMPAGLLFTGFAYPSTGLSQAE
jgi:hypothetical protein